jgi:hypothetical protein
MSQAQVQCQCCFCDMSKEVSLYCDGPCPHAFCFECVCDYMVTSMSGGRVLLNCLHKRACTGYLAKNGMINLVKTAKGSFINLSKEHNKKPPVGNIVTCSTCDSSIRKLAFYNYVSCKCGTVVCYACGRDITRSIAGHSCSLVNTQREPRPVQTPSETVRLREPLSRRRRINLSSTQHVPSQEENTTQVYRAQQMDEEDVSQTIETPSPRDVHYNETVSPQGHIPTAEVLSQIPDRERYSTRRQHPRVPVSHLFRNNFMPPQY